MTRIATGCSADPDTNTAVQACLDTVLDQLSGEPHYLMVHANSAYDRDHLHKALRERLPETSIHGATSCLGVMTDKALCNAPANGMGVWAVTDDGGDFGTGMAEIGENARQSAANAVLSALADAGRTGEIPQIVWISASPGQEEDILAGIQDIVGTDVAIVGGSAADDEIAGQWWMFTHQGTCSSGIVVSVLFTSFSIGTAYHSGYSPSGKHAVVTKAHGRIVEELDGRPAAEVYSEWTGQTFATSGTDPVNVLGSTTLQPLGRERGNLAGSPIYILSHPETVRPDGSISLFTDISVGDVLHHMTGTVESLIERPVNVCASAMEMAELDQGDIEGGIIVYCAGCMLTVRDRLPEVRDNLLKTLPGVPFITTFTFGEQGPVLDEVNRHGNLMISAVLLGDH
ncbi:hypothetical protein GCM10011316_22080 [Roseibium aquae]|uniref:Small ligand-binding sensory domain FIST n=1 Tax=Roseibium aquae TaxID=1323746 RepID=A0A916TKN4_9HYPH|nr:FIST N-terminal domain-containing protein [Roseibium aquae]GGB49533.1 hypothetical protein GCM10011316_22080 [Roseibium aquae]